MPWTLWRPGCDPPRRSHLQAESVIRYRFGQNDLLRTRFAIAPLMEPVGARRCAPQPQPLCPAPPLGAVGQATHRAAAGDPAPNRRTLRHTVLAGSSLAHSPRAPDTQVADELQPVPWLTPPEQVVAEITRTYPGGVPHAGQGFLDDPAGTLAELVTQMQALWRVALAPWWPRISALLESEIAARARRLVAVGGQAAFTDLHPDRVLGPRRPGRRPRPPAARRRRPGRTWAAAGPGRVHLASGVAADRPALGPSPGLPLPGTGDLWTPDTEAGADALEALLGRRRTHSSASPTGPPPPWSWPDAWA